MDTSKEMGTMAEQSFVNCLRSHGHKIDKSRANQDMFEHWDYLVDGKYRVEVKSRKKAKRSDDSPNDSIIYVEFANVRGDPGWLYGKADFIAFERKEGFLLVNRQKLILLAESLISSQYARRPSLYKRYQRHNRPDECVGLLAFSDLSSIPSKLIRYK